jgi:hypothetical protein
MPVVANPEKNPSNRVSGLFSFDGGLASSLGRALLAVKS